MQRVSTNRSNKMSHFDGKVCDCIQILMYFWAVEVCCIEISGNVYMHMCVGWWGYDVKGEMSAVTAGIPGG